MVALRALVIAAVLSVGSITLAQVVTKADLRQHMLENGVSLVAARTHFDLTIDEVASAFGYESIFGFVQAVRESTLVFAECIRVSVSSSGSAADIGLTRESLSSFLNLRRANDLGFIPQCDESGGKREVSLRLRVWTVGDDYPVAHHISATSYINTEDLTDVASNEPFDAEYLGYANATQLRDVAEDTIASIVRDFALLLIKIRE